MNVTVNFTLNGRKTTVSTEGDRPLLDVLREDLQLTGTKYGCGEGRCGACGVLSDGKRIFTCITPVKEAEGLTLVTVEGLSDGGKLHPVQEAFLAEGAYQCGYCTPGMLIAAVSLLKAKPKPTEAEIVAGMNRNLCRCCGYPKIVKAIERAAV